MIIQVLAKSKNGVIGAHGDLPWHLPADLQYFKQLTEGHAVLMGRKTYESIIRRLGHVLPNRRNFVLTRQNITLSDAEVIHMLDALDCSEDIFVIGGAEVYAATLGLAQRLYVTEVSTIIDNGDAFFPALDMTIWREIARESHKKDEKNQFDYDFVTYERA